MSLFKIDKNNIIKLSSKNLGKEKDIQNLFEDNLQTILNVNFLATEYTTSFGGRIDTLGIDNNGSPVIIEYKRNQNDNVINQGLSYLRWLLDHKADFEVLCQKKNIKIKIDWDSPRVICIAESYNKFDLDTIEILPIKIELFRYKLYENDLINLELETQRKISISTSNIYNKNKRSKKREETFQKVYSINTHFEKADKNIKELYENLKEKIVSLDEAIIEEPKAKYIAFKLTTNFVDVVVKKKGLTIFLNVPSGKLEDPNNMARDLTKPKKIGHWGNGDYEVKITTVKELDELFALVKQSYNYNK
jgi:predicted transport protein